MSLLFLRLSELHKLITLLNVLHYFTSFDLRRRFILEVLLLDLSLPLELLDFVFNLVRFELVNFLFLLAYLLNNHFIIPLNHLHSLLPLLLLHLPQPLQQLLILHTVHLLLFHFTLQLVLVVIHRILDYLQAIRADVFALQ